MPHMVTLIFARQNQVSLSCLLCMVQLFSQMENLMSWQFSAFVAREDTTVDDEMRRKLTLSEETDVG